jgi:flagellar hook-associated protein 3 FlgL
MAASTQYSRNASDGLGWLSQADTTLASVTTGVQRAYTLAVQGANNGAMGPAALDSLAQEVDGIRSNLLAQANTTYLDRPIFGGVTSGSTAYDTNGTFVGTPGAVNRRIADGVTVRVDVDGTTVFGDGPTSVFQELSDLSTALRAGDNTGIATGIAQLRSRIDAITAARTKAGVVNQQVSAAGDAAATAQLHMTDNLSTLEDTDLAKATISLQMQQVAYQASLAATSKTIQPSLLDFLR